MKTSHSPALTGIIMPHDWDKDGKVIQIAVYTNAEEVYVVEHTQLGQELLNHINCRVRVSGKKRERLDGSRHIAVQKYVVLEGIVEDKKCMTS